MAVIKKLKKINDYYQMKGNLTSCEANYNEYIYKGEKFVRIQTFGSKFREKRDKQSQVLHINKEIAKQLVEYLTETFKL